MLQRSPQRSVNRHSPQEVKLIPVGSGQIKERPADFPPLTNASIHRLQRLKKGGISLRKITSSSENRPPYFKVGGTLRGRKHPFSKFVRSLSKHPIHPTRVLVDDSGLQKLNGGAYFHPVAGPGYSSSIGLDSQSLESAMPYFHQSHLKRYLAHEMQHRYFAMLRTLNIPHPFHVKLWRDNPAADKGSYTYYSVGDEVYTQFGNARRQLILLRKMVESSIKLEKMLAQSKVRGSVSHYNSARNMDSVLTSVQESLAISHDISADFAKHLKILAADDVEKDYFEASSGFTFEFKERYIDKKRLKTRVMQINISSDLVNPGARENGASYIPKETFAPLAQYYKELMAHVALARNTIASVPHFDFKSDEHNSQKFLEYCEGVLKGIDGFFVHAAAFRDSCQLPEGNTIQVAQEAFRQRQKQEWLDSFNFSRFLSQYVESIFFYLKFKASPVLATLGISTLDSTPQGDSGRREGEYR